MENRLLKTSLGVTAAALIGGVSVASGLRWYDGLDTPSWQPPKQSFGLVWTPLYALIAVGGARVLDAATDEERRAFTRAYAVNLALNAAWTPLFFAARSPRLALADIVALNASTLDLLRRAWRVDRAAAACLTPYVAWTGFATALNVAIVRRNVAARRSPA